MTRTLTVWMSSLFLAAGLMFAAGCGSDDDAGHDDEHDGDHNDGDHDHSKAVGPPSGAECPTNSTLTYDNFGKKFFEDYCIRCHSSKLKGDARMGAPAGHDFDSLAGIELVADHIDQKAAAGASKTNVAMPPDNPKPTVEERKKLGEWLACDLKE